MQITENINRIFLTALVALGTFTAGVLQAEAQSFKLPSAHKAEHRGLIAKQENIKNQISVDETKAFVDNLFKEEEEPEMDIYTEGWESKRVNAYTGMEVPDRKVIDVSNFVMPTPGYMTSPYGYRPRFRRVHKGVDLKLQTGDTVRAAFDGRVRLTNFERKGYGYYVILRHPNGLETVYGHLSKFLVKPDQYVKAGDPIALGGNTGRSFGSHLHFETRFMGYPINPAAIFDFANQTVHTDGLDPVKMKNYGLMPSNIPTSSHSTKTPTTSPATTIRKPIRNMPSAIWHPIPQRKVRALRQKLPPTPSSAATPSAA